MFRGVTDINMDAKGRMALPSRYRDVVSDHCDGHMVATIDTDEPCLLLYPVPEWEVIQQKIEALPSFNKAARKVQRLLIGHATDIDMDANGRLLIPTPLRSYAQLEKKIVLIGQGKKFEIWDEETWRSKRDAWLDEASLDELDLPDEMQNLSI